MSGGRFDYMNDSLCNEIYGFKCSADYGERGFGQSRIARRLNPLQDMIISELVFDVFCLLHSFDWYESGDIDENSYFEDVEFFKNKWLKPIRGKRAKEIVDEELESLKAELYQAFEVELEPKR